MEEILKKLKQFQEKADILSWKRKQKKLENLIETELQPIQEKILELEISKQPIHDKISEIRKEMVETCIHPEDSIVKLSEDTILCKFCNKTIKFYE
jgi:hypothetical protein